jgi:hypothetical protein
VLEENKGKFCKVKGCKRIARIRGYCRKHLEKYYNGVVMDERTIDIELYGVPTCFRCKSAKIMLEKRNIPFDYYEHDQETANNGEYPILKIKKSVWKGKEALLEIRRLINIA